MTWPILAPALFLAMAVAALQTTIWATVGLDVTACAGRQSPSAFALHQWFTIAACTTNVDRRSVERMVG